MKEWQVILITPELEALDPEVLEQEAYDRGYIGRKFSLVTMVWNGQRVALGRGMFNLEPSEKVPSGLTLIDSFDTLEEFHAAKKLNVPPDEEEV